MREILVVGTLMAVSFAEPALADWWIVQSSDKECLVVDVAPVKLVTTPSA